MMVYRSKVGWGIGALTLLPMLITSVFIVRERIWPGLLINSLVLVFLVYLYLKTTYVLEGNRLTIDSTFLIHVEVGVMEIESIAETYNPISAPAFSLDRLEIRYGNRQMVLISPAEKADFIQRLTHVNPNIQIKYRA